MLAYYGDDFTGSTDVLEALDRERRRDGAVHRAADAEHARAVSARPRHRRRGQQPHDVAGRNGRGAAGCVRSRCARLDPAIVHYKVCSTFDSSPQIGSIGRAIDIGHRVFQNRFVPLVVGAPYLQRFCVFGNLFARSGLDSPAYRLDRHPTMRHHPVTPMTEADLRVHLVASNKIGRSSWWTCSRWSAALRQRPQARELTQDEGSDRAVRHAHRRTPCHHRPTDLGNAAARSKSRCSSPARRASNTRSPSIGNAIGLLPSKSKGVADPPRPSTAPSWFPAVARR